MMLSFLTIKENIQLRFYLSFFCYIEALFPIFIFSLQTSKKNIIILLYKKRFYANMCVDRGYDESY